ncbi:MAG: hypothetical protein OEX02_13685 [Cyclobacteriaceae bacterium]|nr:hypothetical protein [Cyclobacteriaceae bacterium]
MIIISFSCINKDDAYKFANISIIDSVDVLGYSDKSADEIKIRDSVKLNCIRRKINDSAIQDLAGERLLTQKSHILIVYSNNISYKYYLVETINYGYVITLMSKGTSGWYIGELVCNGIEKCIDFPKSGEN